MPPIPFGRLRSSPTTTTSLSFDLWVSALRDTRLLSRWNWMTASVYYIMYDIYINLWPQGDHKLWREVERIFVRTVPSKKKCPTLWTYRNQEGTCAVKVKAVMQKKILHNCWLHKNFKFFCMANLLFASKLNFIKFEVIDGTSQAIIHYQNHDEAQVWLLKDLYQKKGLNI